MFIQKNHTHRHADYHAQHKQDNDNTNVAIVQPSCVGICSAFYLPKLGNEPGHPLIAFSATKVTPTAASTSIEKGTWP